MSFINLYDSHTHSDNSPDGRQSVTYMCEHGVALGLRGIAITDHCEVDNYEGGRYHISIRQSNFECLKAKSVFRGSLIVSSGIELGQPLSNIAISEKLLCDYDFDFVLASVHNASNGADYYYIDYSEYSASDVRLLLQDYFEDVLAVARWNRFDSLAHLTYPLRYLHAKGISVELSEYADVIDEILKTLADNQKALEINTSGYRQGLGTPLPPFSCVKRFKELGGEYITIGSDGHRSSDVGMNIQDGMQLALEAGFEQFALYLSRTPMLIDLK